MMDVFKKVLLELRTLWETNRHQINFWVSLLAFVGIILLLIAKWVWRVSISVADISVMISAIGSLIILIGNLLNNQILIATGDKLQDPQFKQALNEANQTIELLTKEINDLKQQQTTVTQQTADK
jgi:hypothetical protein